MTDVVATDNETFQRFLAAAETETAEVDADQVTLEIIGRILGAETVDDVLEGGGAVHARDMLNEPFNLLDVRFNRSDFEGSGPAFYALLVGVDNNGERVTITCGARNVLAQAWKLRDLNALPVAVMLEEAERPTAKGYKPMWLSKAPSNF
jgi:hypothetical protein